jgi:adenine-specific DNA-methyltransferase
MRYIGSKLRLLTFIEETIKEFENNLENKTFCDLFSGTAIVASHFKNKCSKIISNDLENYSYVVQRNYIGNSDDSYCEKLIEKYRKCKPNHGPLTETLSPAGSQKRMFFTVSNAMKVDGIREQIGKDFESKTISEDEYYFLLCSLMESADKVANTTGVYGAFLKSFKDAASKDFELIAHKPIVSKTLTSVNQEDANVLIDNIEGDVLYLDPPYNNRQYSSNYHVLNYICNPESISIKTKLNKNLNKEVESKTALSEYNISKYSRKAEAKKAFEDLISKVEFNKVFISYNDEGIMSTNDIKEILEKYGTYHLRTKEYQRYKSNKIEVDKKKVVEQIHILIKETNND